MFILKEFFPDLTHTEIQFLNKGLKLALSLSDIPPLPRRIIPGEAYPSNQWPDWLKEHACGLLVGFRKVDRILLGYERVKAMNELLEKYIEEPIRKWGTVPFYDGEWAQEFEKYEKTQRE